MTTTIWENNASGCFELNEPYFVQNGDTLIIQQGTIIKCKIGTININGDWSTMPSMLIVCRGGNLHVNGTKTNPIIFTSNETSLDYTKKGLWGGIVILGKNLKSNTSINTFKIFDGIDTKFASAVIAQSKSYYIDSNNKISTTVSSLTLYDACKYGFEDGVDSALLSNTTINMNYVSIRHAGFEITTNKKMSGLSIYGLKSGVLNNIEVYACNNVGFSFKGGSVSSSYLKVGYSGGNAFKFDEGHQIIATNDYVTHTNLLSIVPGNKIIEIGGDETTLVTKVKLNYYSHTTLISILNNANLITNNVPLNSYCNYEI